MERILVVGISGAGKSTLARMLSVLLDLPYVEFDGLYHGPGWARRPAFEADVEAFTAGPRWVTDSMGYGGVTELCWLRADTVVWLDYRRRVAMQRVVVRSVVRAVTRQELWNDNREDPRTWVRADHPMRWAWSQHHAKQLQVRELLADPAHDHLELVHLRRVRETVRWVEGLRRRS